MTQVNSKLINILQKDFPMVERPFMKIGWNLGMSEQEVMKRTSAFIHENLISEISGVFDAKSLDYKTCLVLMNVNPSEVTEFATFLYTISKISHICQTDGEYNLLFTIYYGKQSNIFTIIKELEQMIKPNRLSIFPTLNVFKNEAIYLNQIKQYNIVDTLKEKESKFILHPTDIEIIKYLQNPIEIVENPFAEIFNKTDINPKKFFSKAEAMKGEGVLMQFGAILSKKAIPTLRSKSVMWDVPVYRIESIGNLLAKNNSICYSYQIQPNSAFPYNLFTMFYSQNDAALEQTFEDLKKFADAEKYLVLNTEKEFKREKPRFYN